MGLYKKIAAALVAPLLLNGCFLLPGKFDANLKLLDGGRYEFAYIGEIQMTVPDDKDLKKPEDTSFDPAKLKCRDQVEKTSGEKSEADTVYDDEYDRFDPDNGYDDDYPYKAVARACTKTEIDDQRAIFEQAKERKRKDYEKQIGIVGAMFGGAIPGDEDSMRKFAANLSKYEGWKKVEYVGNNIFNVEYSSNGQVGNYFAFPVLPDAQMQYPFFQVLQRTENTTELLTPSISGQGSLFNTMMFGEMGKDSGPKLKEINGTLTVETTGQVVSNNSADGFQTRGAMKVMTWKIGKDAGSQQSPRVLVKF